LQGLSVPDNSVVNDDDDSQVRLSQWGRFCNRVSLHLLESLEKLGATDNSKIAIALSGGVDSMALLLAASEILGNSRISALTVDHGLRGESANEALAIAAICAELGIAHTILSWQHNSPQANVQEQAREARYALMLDWCQQNNTRFLLIAHHLDDQVETFFLNLGRGSGVYGLSAMPQVIEQQGIFCIRPMLEIPKTEIIKAAQEKNLRWFEDPTNAKNSYKRNRIRAAIPGVIESLHQADDGFSVSRINLAIKNIARARNALDFYTERHIKNSVEFAETVTGISAIINAEIFWDAPEEVKFRSFAKIIQTIGGNNTVPRLEKTINALRMIKTTKSLTLGGCLVKAQKNTIVISRAKA
jgi:tRNA(Ile)-lysidine synthase